MATRLQNFLKHVDLPHDLFVLSNGSPTFLAQVNAVHFCALLIAKDVRKKSRDTTEIVGFKKELWHWRPNWFFGNTRTT